MAHTDRPSRETPKEYREVIEHLIDVQEWRYDKSGKGHPVALSLRPQPSAATSPDHAQSKPESVPELGRRGPAAGRALAPEEMTMTWWSVLIEAAAPADAERLAVDDERFDALVDAVTDYDGVITGGADRYSVRLSVEADDALHAVMHARDIVWKSTTNVGLPEWPFIHVDALTHDELGDELARPPFPDLLGAAEVATILGVSRQRLAEIRQVKHDFPRPVVELAAGPVWVRSAIDGWAKGWARKPGRPTTRKEVTPATAQQRPGGGKAAKAASKVLRDGGTSKTSKAAAGRALSQPAPRRRSSKKK